MNLIRHHIDEHLSHLSSKAVTLLNSIMVFTAGLTLSDWLDLSQKWVTFIITVVVGVFSARHYYLKNRKLKKESELLDQQIYKAIEDNKHRSNGN